MNCKPRTAADGAYTLGQTAARIGVSAERLRKVWKTWMRERAFPCPITAPPTGNYAWDVAAVETWVAARTQALGYAAVPLTPIRPEGGMHGATRLNRQRDQLAALMERA